jgi:mannose-6-phosphate isomerase-like protein (cupin superfamily)
MVMNMAENEEPGLLAFERALGMTDLSGETEAERLQRQALERQLAPLAGLLDPVPPSNDLFARIAAKAGLETPLAGIHATRAGSDGWKTTTPGIAVKTLWRSAHSRRRTYLVRMDAGAVMPMHDHEGDEETYILEGDMQVNGVTFGPGDYQVALAGTKHPIITTIGGCLCYVSVAH